MDAGGFDCQQDGDVGDEAGGEFVEEGEEVGLSEEKGLDGGGVEGEGKGRYLARFKVS